MKPLRHVYEEIASVENLFRAAEATLARGRRFRGGNWNNASVNARASDRNNAANVNADRNNNNGGRAVRSAPSGVGTKEMVNAE